MTNGRCTEYDNYSAMRGIFTSSFAPTGSRPVSGRLSERVGRSDGDNEVAFVSSSIPTTSMQTSYPAHRQRCQIWKAKSLQKD
ncbi:hypothetical protein D9613_000068 [Agrocybe pediades]|uniref:Uncharacterized protein n=1 Tax=Agrocybe pediades TaxID=84607 RepID=A0A8H4R273_9AGAR|nr:hypothetical protein D9613_000068 [Agrocybe pediades]